MAGPQIIWRNPRSIGQKRLWSRARQTETSSIYVVVRSRGGDTEWEGLPNLEVRAGGAPRANQRADSNVHPFRESEPAARIGSVVNLPGNYAKRNPRDP